MQRLYHLTMISVFKRWSSTKRAVRVNIHELDVTQVDLDQRRTIRFTKRFALPGEYKFNELSSDASWS